MNANTEWEFLNVKRKEEECKIIKEQEKQIFNILFSVGVMRKDVTIDDVTTHGSWFHFQYYGMQVNFSNQVGCANASIHRPALNKEEEKILNHPPIMSLGYQSLESDAGKKFRKDFLYGESVCLSENPVLYLNEILESAKKKAFEQEKLRQSKCG